MFAQCPPQEPPSERARGAGAIMLALLTVALGWTAARLPSRVPSRARALACNEYADEVGQYFTLDDAGRLGPWYMPTTWWRSARERVEAVRHPRSEAGFAWEATHTEGRVLFAEASVHGNKVVRVNQHGPWRCLTTCGEVEQGLAYFDGATPQPQVLGYQYLRVMLAAALGFCALAPSAPSGDGPRIVCVGLGTGALPGYLAHHLVTALETDADPAQVRAEPLLAPSQLVAVEIDPVVVRAAAQHLGCRFYVDSGVATAGAAAEPEAKAEAVAAVPATAESPLPSGAALEGEAGAFCVTVCDAATYVRTLRGASVAAVFLDAFDGEGETPAHLLAPVFLRECREALAPGGVLVCNLFNGAGDSKARANVEAVARKLREDVGPVYSLQVAGQEESVVLVARCGEALQPPGVTDLRRAARGAARAAGMRLRAGALVRQLLWVEVREDEAGGGVVEVRPPATTGRVPWWNGSGRVPWWRRAGRQGTSACERLSGGSNA